MNRFFTIILAFLALACQSESPKDSVVTNNKKTFKSIKIDRYSVKDRNPDSTTLSTYIIKEFDTLGTEISSIYYSADNSIMMKFFNQYKNGNKTRVNWVNAENDTVRYVNMSYNRDNQLIRSESFNNSDKFISGFIHQWKKDGTIEEKGPIEEGKEFKPNSIYSYNDQKEMTSLVEFDENDSLYGTFTWNYIDFDQNKEWTKRYMLFNDTLVRVETRNIEYQK